MISTAEAHDRLVRATDRLVTSCGQVPESLWTPRPRPSSWSPSEVVEHVALANGIISAVFDTIASKPVGGSRVPDLADEEIPFLFYGGDEPPGVATPTGEWTDQGDAYEHLRTSANGLSERVAAVDADLRAVGARHPAFGLLDGVQWVLFSFAHVERHRGDIRQVIRALTPR